MTNRLVELIGALAPVVNVTVYSVHELLIEEIVAVAKIVPVVDSRSTVSGPVKPEAGFGEEVDAIRSGGRDSHAEITGVRNANARSRS